jgi:O-antigen ligase
VALLIIASGLRWALRPATRESLRWWQGLLDRLVSRLRGLDERWLAAAVFAAAALFVLSPWLPLDLASLALLVGLLAIRPDLLLPLVAFAIPFFLRPKQILGREFSYVEILTLVGTALLICQSIGRRWFGARGATGEATPAGRQVQESHGTPSASRLSSAAVGIVRAVVGLDWPVLAFVLVAALSLLTANNRGVAQREFRVVIVDAALFYLLVSRIPRRDGRRFSIWPMVDGLVLGALAVSCLGLWQFATGQGRVDVEGVWRIRALYGSPNNLGLYLGRVVPLLGAVAAFAHTRWRRWVYGLLLVPVGLACVATFSKGALLLGLPAALLFLGLVGSLRAAGRKRWRPLAIAMLLLLLASVALVPLFRTERFAGLFDFTQGTSFIRLQLWRGALNMALDRPWLGVGLDNFLYEYRTRYVLPSAWQELNLSHPHNIVLDFWTRLGLLGLAAGVWLFVAGFRSGWRLWLRTPRGDREALLLGLLASLVATVAHGLIDNSIFLVDLAYVFMLTLGVFQRLEIGRWGPGRDK